MKKYSDNPIVVDAGILSRSTSRILEGKSGRPLTKNEALKILTEEIMGNQKFNWGYLTGAQKPVIATHLNTKYEVLSRHQSAPSDRHTFTSLGFSRQQAQTLDEITSHPLGLTLIGGPAGSGKSTISAQMVRRFIEHKDPMDDVIGIFESHEQTVNGVRYLTWDGPIYNTANQALWQAVRLDHVVLIWTGEVRNYEYLDPLLQTSMIGHKLIANMHAANAIGILNRLKDMGAEDYKIYDHRIISGLISQRLVQTLCPHCKIPLPDALRCLGVNHRVQPDCIENLERSCAPLGLMYTRNRSGCDHCRNGQGGRTLVAEVMKPNQNLMECLEQGNKEAALYHWEEELGGVSMKVHGFAKVIAGLVCPQDLENSVGLISSLSWRDHSRAMAVAKEYLPLD